MGPIAAFLLMALTPISPRYSATVSVGNLPPFPSPGQQTVVEIPAVDPGFAWTEAIVSWNVAKPSSAYVGIEAKGVYPDHETKWYTIAHWSGALTRGSRESVRDQKDDDGTVLTDTLRLTRPGAKLVLRLTLSDSDKEAALKLLTVNFTDPSALPTQDVPNKEAWGKTIEVPQRSQMTYEHGKLHVDPALVNDDFQAWFKNVKSAQFCSPTSVSMILWHWSQTLDRTDLNEDVPQVVPGVWDKAWPGTGNWPFNTAFIGSHAGMRAYVTRLPSVADLETLIAAGYPVATSIAYNLLRGNGKPAGGDGHLVVLVGFTDQGDPVFNDPGWSVHVRQVYKRADFIKAWADSGNTVYLVHPESAKLPASPDGSWLN